MLRSRVESDRIGSARQFFDWYILYIFFSWAARWINLITINFFISWHNDFLSISIYLYGPVKSIIKHFILSKFYQILLVLRIFGLTFEKFSTNTYNINNEMNQMIIQITNIQIKTKINKLRAQQKREKKFKEKITKLQEQVLKH